MSVLAAAEGSLRSGAVRGLVALCPIRSLHVASQMSEGRTPANTGRAALIPV